MAILSITEAKPPSGSRIFDMQGRRWIRTYRRVLRVRVDSPTVGPAAVIAALPAGLGAAYSTPTEGDPYAYLIGLDVQDEGAEDFLHRTVTLDYGPIDPAQWPEDPTLHPPEISGGFNKLERVVEEDVTGNPVTNGAGDPFDPPLACDDSRPVLTITKNLKTIDPALFYLYRDATNSDIFCGEGPGNVKVLNITYDRTFDPIIGFYWQVRYEFEFNPDGWNKRLLSQGLRQLNAAGTALVPILISGSPATEPVRLDAAGRAITDPHADSHYIDYQVYESRPFAALGLADAQAIILGTA